MADPLLAESSRRLSPYNYANDNPLRFIDPDGRRAAPVEGFESNVPLGGLMGYYTGGGSSTFGSIEEYTGTQNPFIGMMSGGGGDGSEGAGNSKEDYSWFWNGILNLAKGNNPTTLNYEFQFGEWDYIYREMNGMITGTSGPEFFTESRLDDNPYTSKFDLKNYRKVNNIIAGLTMSITIVKLKNGEYSISTNPMTTPFSSSAYDANAIGDSNINYIGNGKGYLNILFQITNKEQALKRKIWKIDGQINVKDSHTAMITVSYPFTVLENKGDVSLQFGHAINFKSYNLNALMIAEGIRYIPLTSYEFLGPPIQTVDYNYQLKKK